MNRFSNNNRNDFGSRSYSFRQHAVVRNILTNSGAYKIINFAMFILRMHYPHACYLTLTNTDKQALSLIDQNMRRTSLKNLYV